MSENIDEYGQSHARSDESPDDTDPLLTVEELETVFRTNDGVVRAVDGVNFDIRRGEVVGLVGESGAGKSATARSVARLIESPGDITGGTVTFAGDNVLDMSDAELRQFRSNDMGMIFQDPSASLNPTQPVGAQVAESVEQHLPEISSDDARSRAVELLETVGIPDANRRSDDYPHEFSGGQKQRIVTAIAIACEPDLLIADEPTTALDVTVQAQILDLIDDLRETLGMAVLFITHDLGVVRELCDRCAVMYAGSVVETGSVEQLFEAPKHPYTKGLLQSIPGGDGGFSKGVDGQLRVIEGTMPELTNDFEGCKYADRCPGATEQCRADHPELTPLADSRTEHAVACYHSDAIGEIEYSTTVRNSELSWDANVQSPDEQDASVLRVEGLEKQFSQGSILQRLTGSSDTIRAVDGINIEISAGKTVGLVGESGCGKSTAVRSILRLLEPTGGDVIYRGRSLTDMTNAELREQRRNLQMVFQDPQSSLNPRKTVRQIVSRPIELHSIGDSDRRQQRVHELIQAVGLDERHLDRYAHELSGGQQQRVGIARALAVNPEVIMLDEPVSGLDVSIQAKILNLLTDLQQQLNLVYLFISHDISVVKHVCDEIAVMYLGEIVEYGSAEEVFSPPYHPYTESLLSAVPSNNTNQDRIILEGDVPDPSNIPSGCRFHPRCPRKIGEVCEVEEPMDYGDDHQINCHLLRDEYGDEVDWNREF